jgi:hypothetical protein
LLLSGVLYPVQTGARLIPGRLLLLAVFLLSLVVTWDAKELLVFLL